PRTSAPTSSTDSPRPPPSGSCPGRDGPRPRRADGADALRQPREEPVVSRTIADVLVATLKASGVRRIYGLPGDSINGLTDALRRDGDIAWQHVRHEEAAAFAAAG